MGWGSTSPPLKIKGDIVTRKIKKIRILGTGYHGKPVNNVFVPSGDYDVDEEILNGQAEYLVKNGHAEVIGEIEEKAKPKKSPNKEE
jgi:hypothetical protein